MHSSSIASNTMHSSSTASKPMHSSSTASKPVQMQQANLHTRICVLVQSCNCLQGEYASRLAVTAAPLLQMLPRSKHTPARAGHQSVQQQAHLELVDQQVLHDSHLRRLATHTDLVATDVALGLLALQPIETAAAVSPRQTRRAGTNIQLRACNQMPL
jgi:hypothetical protein